MNDGEGGGISNNLELAFPKESKHVSEKGVKSGQSYAQGSMTPPALIPCTRKQVLKGLFMANGLKVAPLTQCPKYIFSFDPFISPLLMPRAPTFF